MVYHAHGKVYMYKYYFHASFHSSSCHEPLEHPVWETTAQVNYNNYTLFPSVIVHKRAHTHAVNRKSFGIQIFSDGLLVSDS